MQTHRFESENHAAFTWLATLAFMIVALGWLGPLLDRDLEQLPRPADPVRAAVQASQSADQAACESMYGPHATAVQLPDGQHRCLDKHGRRLRNVITIAEKVTR